MKNTTLWCISKKVTFRSSNQKYEGLFSSLDRENLVELLDIKLTKVWGSHKTCIPPPQNF